MVFSLYHKGIRVFKIAGASFAGVFAISVLLAGTAPGAFAQQVSADSPPTPLDDLLNARISASAKYEQPVRDVPASTTIITAEEIERYGFETLPDVLNSIRGLYISYDRNYSYLGVRGFSPISDYNNRLLVLIDGHSINEPVFGSAAVGTDLVVDLDSVERIEFVRGPGSVIYGTGAMFGVLNVVMKKSDGTPTASATARAGSAGFRSGTASATTAIGGTNIAVSGLWRSVAGKDLYFPEFATGGSDGIARGRDYDHSEGILARISRGGFEATLHYGTRTKGEPGASYGSNFNEDEGTSDRHTFVDLAYDRKLTPSLAMTLHGYWDRDLYDGHYPMSPTLFDYSLGVKFGFESRLAWDVRANDRLTLGAEVMDAARAEYRYWGNGANDLKGTFVTVSGYVQNEYQPLSNLSVTAGLRMEHNTAVGNWFTPRVAVVFNPSAASTLKVLYGQAYRAPDVYALQIFDAGGIYLKSHGLEPENIRTVEIVYERRINSSIAMFASLYSNKAEGLIELEPSGDGLVQYRNDPVPIHANGAELQIDYRSPSGIWAYASWARVRARDHGASLTNSPNDLVKLGASTNPFGRAHAGIDLDYETSRIALDGTSTNPFVVVNATSSFALTKHLRAGLTVRNLFDRHYAIPVGSEFRAPTMQQDGRTLELMLRGTR